METKGKFISREKFLKKQEFKIEQVIIDETTGDFVYIKQMSGFDRDRLEQSMTIQTKDEKGNEIAKVTTENFKAKMICATVCDENGVLLLKPDDYKTINANFTADAIENLSNKASDLNKIRQKDQEDAVKN